jgi:hypothetical protein
VLLTDAPAKYLGHEEHAGVVYDAFELVNPFECGGCGTVITHYLERCGEPVSLGEIFSISEKEIARAKDVG